MGVLIGIGTQWGVFIIEGGLYGGRVLGISYLVVHVHLYHLQFRSEEKKALNVMQFTLCETIVYKMKAIS